MILNYLGQKSKLEELHDDLIRMQNYAKHVNGCTGDINACWFGNKDKQKLMSALAAHVTEVNQATAELNLFKQTATFVLNIMNELGKLLGDKRPNVSPIGKVPVCNPSHIDVKIKIDTSALRLVADKIDREKKLLQDTTFSIKGTNNILDALVLNVFGLAGLLKTIDTRIEALVQENTKIVLSIRKICDLYESTEMSLKKKIEAIGIVGASAVIPPATPKPKVNAIPKPGKGTIKTSLPDWVYTPNENPTWYMASNGAWGSVYAYNDENNTQLSCTFYTLRKLRERGLGFPFVIAGQAMGNEWFDNCTNDVPKYPGDNCLRDIIAQNKLPVENIVISFEENHVLLIDKIDAAGKITYSDMNPDIADMNGSNPAITLSIDEFMAKQGNIRGAAIIGSK